MVRDLAIDAVCWAFSVGFFVVLCLVWGAR
jgi:nucleoside phosphorylase